MKEIDDRFFELIDILIAKKVIASEYQFAKDMGKFQQHINNIKKIPSRHFSIKDIYMAHKLFDVNPNWFFGLDNEVFYSKKQVSTPS